VIAAKLGVRVGVVTKVGPDMPRELLQPFEEAGVDTRGMREGPATTTSHLIYDRTGGKEIRYPARAEPILFEDIPAAYLGSRSFHVCPMDYDSPVETVERLASRGATISVDLGGFGGAHSSTHPDPQERRVPHVLPRLIRCCTIVRASLEDCRHLFERVPDDGADLAGRFIEWGARIGIVTLGDRGAVVATADGVARVPALSGRVVDATGAGDAFSAGFLVEYLHGSAAVRCARFASAVALHVISGTGGVRAARMPSRTDVERLLAAAAFRGAEEE
jgi:ribokinase